MIKTELNKECGIRLKECLAKFSMTQNELSSLTGYTQQYISNIIVGKKPMTVKAAKLFSEHLDVCESYLLCENDLKTSYDKLNYLKNICDKQEECIFELLNAYGPKILTTIIYTDTKNFCEEGVSELFDILAGNISSMNYHRGKKYDMTDMEFIVTLHTKKYVVPADKILDFRKFITEYITVFNNRIKKECKELI